MKKNNMTKTLLLLVMALGMNVSALLAQNVGVNVDDPQATLEVRGINPNNDVVEGLLIPRVSKNKAYLMSINDSLKESTMVYVNTLADYSTEPAAAAVADITENGFYFWNGTKWVQSAGQDGAEWVTQGDRLVLRRSGQGTFANKVYYNKNGGLNSYVSDSIQYFDPSSNVWVTIPRTLQRGGNYFQQQSSNIGTDNNSDKILFANRLDINEDPSIPNTVFTASTFHASVNKGVTLDNTHIRGVSSYATHEGQGRANTLRGGRFSGRLRKGSAGSVIGVEARAYASTNTLDNHYLRANVALVGLFSNSEFREVSMFSGISKIGDSQNGAIVRLSGVDVEHQFSAGASQTIALLNGLRYRGIKRENGSPNLKIGTHIGLVIEHLTGGENNYGIKLGNVYGGENNYAIKTTGGKVEFGDVTHLVHSSNDDYSLVVRNPGSFAKGTYILGGNSPGASLLRVTSLDSTQLALEVRLDGVGIGTNSPTEKLEVAGKVKAANVIFTGIPEYADDAAAGAGGLVSGEMYKTATGDLRIKL